jgi:hypothetical protein
MSTSAVRALRVVSLALLLAGPAGAADDPIEDIVAVLREKGLIDDATEQQILAKRMRQQAAETPPVSAGFEFLEGFSWFGDLRLRNEQFWYDSSFGDEADDRNRFRYRARIGFAKPVSERVRIGMRLVSAAEFNSTNESFGNLEDFSKDFISIDQVWAELTLSGADSAVATMLTAGKLENPFIWKNSFDRILWDADITPEGFYLHAAGSPGETGKLWGTLGYFVVDENSTSEDPKVFGLQLGGSLQVSESTELGARISGFEWRSLDDAFIARNLWSPQPGSVGPTTGGNLTGAFDDDRARIAETTAYLRLARWAGWPALVYATFVQNLDAESVGGLGREDSAWGAGFEIGDEKRLARLAAGYFRVEANSTPSRYTDSDLFDGFTNREGFMFSVQRELAARILLRFTYFDGEEIRTGLVDPALGDVGFMGERADRKRLQSDVEIKF